MKQEAGSDDPGCSIFKAHCLSVGYMFLALTGKKVFTLRYCPRITLSIVYIRRICKSFQCLTAYVDGCMSEIMFEALKCIVKRQTTIDDWGHLSEVLAHCYSVSQWILNHRGHIKLRVDKVTCLSELLQNENRYERIQWVHAEKMQSLLCWYFLRWCIC